MCFFSRDVITGIRKGVGKNIKLDETLSHLGFFLNLWYRMKTMIVPNNLSRGVIKCEIHIFAPPLLDSYFSPKIFITMRWCASQAKNYAFPPFFSSPFNHFFPPNMIFGHIFWSNRKIYTPERRRVEFRHKDWLIENKIQFFASHHYLIYRGRIYISRFL